jgi:hypothetical protein
MDAYDIASDPCDNRIIACNNCLQMAACCCNILAMVDESFLLCAQVLDLIATTVFYTVQACMTAQTYHEWRLKNPAGSEGERSNQMVSAGPTSQHMEKRW